MLANIWIDYVIPNGWTFGKKDMGGNFSPDLTIFSIGIENLLAMNPSTVKITSPA